MCATILGQAVVPLVGGKGHCTGRSTTSSKHWRYGTTRLCRTGWRSPLLTGAASLVRIFCHLGYRDPRTILPAFPSSNSTLLLLALQQFHSPPSEEVERVAVRLLGARLGCLEPASVAWSPSRLLGARLGCLEPASVAVCSSPSNAASSRR